MSTNGQVEQEIERLIKRPYFFALVFWGKGIYQCIVHIEGNAVFVPIGSVAVKAFFYVGERSSLGVGEVSTCGFGVEGSKDLPGGASHIFQDIDFPAERPTHLIYIIP